MSASTEPTAARGYACTPTATPIADTIHTLAAVVRPNTKPSVRMMLPAPKKPTPVTTPCTTRVASRLGPPNASTACFVVSTNIVLPRHTSTCVRSPAGLRPICRSSPTSVPSSSDTTMGIRSSRTTSKSRFPPSAPLEAGGALVEERLEPLVHVLARGEDAEAAALEAQALLERELHAAHDALERRRHRERAVLEDRLRELDRLVHELRQRHDPVHEPDALGFVGLDVARGEDQLERPARPHETRQPLRAAVAGDDAELDFRQPQYRIVGSQPHVARECQLATSTERVAVDRGDHRLRALLEQVHDLLAEARDVLGRGGPERGQLVDVRPGDERLLSLSGDHQRALLGIGDERARRIGDLAQRLAVDRVQDLRAVHEQQRDLLATLEAQVLVRGQRGRAHGSDLDGRGGGEWRTRHYRPGVAARQPLDVS